MTKPWKSRRTVLLSRVWSAYPAAARRYVLVAALTCPLLVGETLVAAAWRDGLAGMVLNYADPASTFGATVTHLPLLALVGVLHTAVNAYLIDRYEKARPWAMAGTILLNELGFAGLGLDLLRGNGLLGSAGRYDAPLAIVMACLMGSAAAIGILLKDEISRKWRKRICTAQVAFVVLAGAMVAALSVRVDLARGEWRWQAEPTGGVTVSGPVKVYVSLKQKGQGQIEVYRLLAGAPQWERYPITWEETGPTVTLRQSPAGEVIATGTLSQETGLMILRPRNFDGQSLPLEYRL